MGTPPMKVMFVLSVYLVQNLAVRRSLMGRQPTSMLICVVCRVRMMLLCEGRGVLEGMKACVLGRLVTRLVMLLSSWFTWIMVFALGMLGVKMVA